MNKELTKKQRRRFFLINVAAFALIFLLLGLITLQLLQRSAYRQTDLALKNAAEDNRMIQMEIDRYQQDDPFLPFANGEQPPAGNPANNRFNTQIILWSKNGEILNKDTLGGRFNELRTLKLKTDQLNTVTNFSVKSQDATNANLSFHTITLPVKNNSTIAYAQILANTDQITDSMNTFRTILIVCMVIFWLLSIAISFYLSKMNMQPILASWRKQQEFVENASHELRTPLTIIQNSLQHLFTKPDHTIMEESETIAQALNETRRLTGLTSDLLMIARGDSNQLVLDKKAVDTHEFIAQLAKPFQEIALMKDKQFILENFAAETLLFDEKKIHQVLVILLDNALKYTDPGDKIILQSEISNDAWLLEVKNTGPSISDVDKKHIFERFYREDRSRSKDTGGYGLGLAIAQQIITQHDGKLSVRDLLPQGVIFQIKLPRQKAKK